MGIALREWTTFGIGGDARRLTVAKTAEELIELAPRSLVLGGGSNVLVSDGGYDGEVVINRYADISRRGSLIIAGSGARLPRLSDFSASEGLSGLEWAGGIPGTVGGAVVMNAGAFGSCIADRILYADILRDGDIVRVERRELGFSYRHSDIRHADTVVSAAFLMTQGKAGEIRMRTAELAARRAAAQPKERSAGSVFKNPPGMSVAKLIDGAGLKGYTVGGAAISNKHANFIVNLGGATAKDVCAVIQKVKDTLAEKGVKAEEELIYIGEF